MCRGSCFLDASLLCACEGRQIIDQLARRVDIVRVDWGSLAGLVSSLASCDTPIKVGNRAGRGIDNNSTYMRSLRPP